MKRFIRDAIFDTIYNLAKDDEDIVLITADADAFGLRRFKEDYAERFLNVGVAEQAMISMAAGMALAGKKVFVYAIAPFVTLRCLEQIKVNLCMMNLPVFILGLGIGSAYGFDGPTHQSIFDVGIMASMPNITVYNPADYVSAEYVVREALNNKKPAYIRMDRDSFEDIYIQGDDMEKGFSLLKNDNKDKLIISTGICTHYAFRAECDADILDIYNLNSFDKKKLVDVISKYKILVIYEEQWEKAGIAMQVYDLIFENEISIKVKKVGIPEEKCLLHEFGNREWLHEKYKILPADLKSVVESC